MRALFPASQPIPPGATRPAVGHFPLELRQETPRTPQAGEVQITVTSAGVNRADLLQAAGLYPPPPEAPTSLGLECAGTISALGQAVEGWRVGQPVCALLPGGGCAEVVTCQAELLAPAPASWELRAAGGLLEAAATAWSNLVWEGHLRPGMRVLIQGGSGGVGSFAIQLATALGAKVWTTAGTPERRERCVLLGAARAFDYRAPDLVAQITAATDGGGVDLILDVAGAGALSGHVEMLAPGGKVLVIGLQKGRRVELDLGKLLAKNAAVVGTALRQRPLSARARLLTELTEKVWPLLAAGTIIPVVHGYYALEEAAQAHTDLANGAVFGKVLLLP